MEKVGMCCLARPQGLDVPRVSGAIPLLQLHNSSMEEETSTSWCLTTCLK
ncbi:Hypothetical predicted protein [Paramuricea clavata]|uniref:Uncharacterized protein n=1 Tax=Paramuricea clavata TaxID=317549 RepID=A0A6S7IRX3_PARCT|nr:Hypothetical predicted protein [Paramuricea clavata]